MTSRVDDPTFAALPRALQRRIDNAFRCAICKTSSRKRRKLNDNGLYEQDAPGGFIPDDSVGGGFTSDSNALEGGFMLEEPEAGGGFIFDEEEDGGGFVPEPSPPRAGPSTIPVGHNSEVQGEEGSPDYDPHIPLSLIPTALQILDLPPGDEQVLLIFKNAASGWTSGSTPARRASRIAGPAEEVVSLRDWRAVCAVLLEPDSQDVEVDEDDGMERDGDARMSDGLAEDSGGSGEEYVESDSGGDSDGQDLDDDNYSDTPAKRSTRSTRRSMRENKGFDGSDEEGVDIKKNRPLTARQREASRQAFAFFLPESTDADLEKQRITISDLVRVSKELNEKITYDQVRKFPSIMFLRSLTTSLVQMVEMLSFISTSQDKMSVSLADFGRMMVDAKLA